MSSKQTLVLLLFVFFFLPLGFSQVEEVTYGPRFSYGLKAGVNLGTPFGKAEKGAKGSLGVGLNAGPLVRYNFYKLRKNRSKGSGANSRWSIQLEPSFSHKLASFETPVKDVEYLYRQEIEIPVSTVILGVVPSRTVVLNVETFFNGNINGGFSNKYVEVPVLAMYRISDRVHLSAGPYIAYLLEGQNVGTATGIVGDNFVEVEDEPFDESVNLNLWDYGVTTGVNYERGVFFADVRVATGLTSIYKPEYTMADGTVRNIYLQTSLGVRFDHYIPRKHNTDSAPF